MTGSILPKMLERKRASALAVPYHPWESGSLSPGACRRTPRHRGVPLHADHVSGRTVRCTQGQGTMVPMVPTVPWYTPPYPPGNILPGYLLATTAVPPLQRRHVSSMPRTIIILFPAPLTTVERQLRALTEAAQGWVPPLSPCSLSFNG